MKRKLFIIVLVLITSFRVSAQTNYRDLLVQDNQSFWATAVSLFDSIENTTQAGMRLDKDGYFEWYYITNENDTLSAVVDRDTRMYTSHFTYKVCGDTLYVVHWPKKHEGVVTETICYREAYKILYLTEQKMLLMQLVKNKKGAWEEYTFPPHYRSTVVEYRYMKPLNKTTK